MSARSANGNPTSSGKLVLKVQSAGKVAASNKSTVLCNSSSVKSSRTGIEVNPRNEALPFTVRVLPLGLATGPCTATDNDPCKTSDFWMIVSKSGAGVRFAVRKVALETVIRLSESTCFCSTSCKFCKLMRRS